MVRFLEDIVIGPSALGFFALPFFGLADSEAATAAFNRACQGLDNFGSGTSNLKSKLSTPWKINMEPENDGLEDDFPFQLGGF